MARIEAWFNQDLKKAVKVQYLDGNVFSQDNNGNVLGVNVFDNGSPASLSGSISANIVRADGATVAATGSFSGNQAYVVLPQSAYAVPGILSVVLKLTSGEDVTTLLCVVGNVYMSSTDSIVDPGTIIPSIQTLIDEIEAAIASVPADYSALLAAIAGTYSAASAYMAGDYCWYEGSLYRCVTNIPVGESWNASHWHSVAIANDVAKLNDVAIAVANDSKNIANLFNPATITSGYYLGSAGQLIAGSNYFVSDFIDVSALGYVSSSYAHIFCGYDENRVCTGYINPDHMQTILYDSAIQIPAGVKYIRFSTETQYLNIVQVGPNVSRGDYKAYPALEIESDIPKIERVNLFNPARKTDGFYLGDDGYGRAASGYFLSGFIDISDYDALNLSYTHIVGWYTANMAFMWYADNMNSILSDTRTFVPSGAKYLRFSTESQYLNSVQIGPAVTRQNYVPYSRYTLPGFDAKSALSDDAIIVDVSGAWDYTSFTRAIYETVYSGRDVVVKPGTYDIEAEYYDLFGSSVVDSMSDSTTGIKEFQFGVVLRNRKVTFEPGAHLVCDWTGHTVDNTHRFCALRFEYDIEVVGLDLECTATMYGIHDDYGTPDNAPFTNVYRDCRIVCHNLTNVNCIGAGCHKFSRHIIENCYFKNNSTYSGSDPVLSADVRYHNTYVQGAEPEIFVSNCYFSNNFNACYYGPQTSKMRVYVNNCFAPKGINKVREDASYNVDNVDLFTWNNQST